MRANFLVNIHRQDAVDVARDTAQWLISSGVEVLGDPESRRMVGIDEVSLLDFGDADLVVCFGGDGTLITGAHLCSERGTPILGVYYGRFGFVTQAKGTDLRACIRAFLDKELPVEERMMLEAELVRGEETLASIHALNEVVLQRAVEVRMLTFDVTVDGLHLTTYPADGVLVATATGSTAYNLSAGGPIVDPRVKAMILSALAPHTLSARPLVLSDDSEIILQVATRGDAILSADGQSRFHLLSGDKVRIRKSPRVTRLVSVERNDFLLKLRQRLLWSQSILGELEG